MEEGKGSNYGGSEIVMAMVLKTRVFELCDGKYTSMAELARDMRISLALVSRVHLGKRKITATFILGAVKAFPGYKLDDLFYIAPDQRKGHN